MNTSQDKRTPSRLPKALAFAILALINVLTIPSVDAAGQPAVERQIETFAPITCMSEVRAAGSASGYAPFVLKKHLARRRALRTWRRKTTRSHGKPFRHWRHATGRQVRCEPSIGRVLCVASARPCDPGYAAGSLF